MMNPRWPLPALLRLLPPIDTSTMAKKHKRKRGEKAAKKAKAAKSSNPTSTRLQVLPPADDAAPVILVDCNNVRGVNDFAYSLAEFVSLLERWTLAASLGRRVICLVDHGRTADAFHYSSSSSSSSSSGGGGLVVAFAGTGRTADDVIADDAQWWAGRGAKVAVVTNDRGLKRRLGRSYSSGNGQRQQQQRVAPSGKVKCFSSDRFLVMLERAGSGLIGESGTLGESHLAPLQLAETRIRAFSSSSSSLSASAEPAVLSSSSCSSSSSSAAAATAAPCCYPERTWERVLAAEVLRRCLSGYEASSRISLAAASSSSPLPPPAPPAESAASASAVAVVDLDLAAHLQRSARTTASTITATTGVDNGDGGGGDDDDRDEGEDNEGGGTTDLTDEGVDARHLAAYLAARRRPLDLSKGLVWDHRIRHDKGQQWALGDFARAELQKAPSSASSGGEGGGNGEGGGDGDGDGADDFTAQSYSSVPPPKEGAGERWIEAAINGGLY